MRPQNYLAAIALVLSSAACVGSLDTMTGGDDTGDDTIDPPQSVARMMFESDVSPLLTSACSSCHTGAIDTINDTSYNYMGATGATGYYAAVTLDTSITGGFDPGLSNLLNKGLHDNGNARAWTQTEADAITEWLLTEADERGIELDPEPPVGTTPTTSREALAQWSGCMSINDWTTSLVFQWANKGSDRGQCMSCHNQGAGGFFASDDENNMFEMNRYEVYLTTFFTAAPVSVTDPSQGYRVLVNEQKLRQKANAVGHPSYNPDGGQQMQYLNDFYNRTLARITAGTCPAQGFPETPPPAQ
jgi:hypothetical protein